MFWKVLWFHFSSSRNYPGFLAVATSLFSGNVSKSWNFVPLLLADIWLPYFSEGNCHKMNHISRVISSKIVAPYKILEIYKIESDASLQQYFRHLTWGIPKDLSLVNVQSGLNFFVNKLDFDFRRWSEAVYINAYSFHFAARSTGPTEIFVSRVSVSNL